MRLRASDDTSDDPTQPIRGIELEFDRSVPMTEVAGTLQLARLAAESVHGTERVELDAVATLDRRARRVAIDTTTPSGHTLALVFLGYARREFGADTVTVYRSSVSAAGETVGAA
jgi:hypothetical protein